MIAGTLTTGQLFAPDAAQAASWTLRPSMAVTGSYNDNVNFAPDNEEGDLALTLIPLIRVLRTTDRSELSALYHADIEHFLSHEDLNNIGHTGALRFSLLGLGGGPFRHAQLDVDDAVTYTENLNNVSLAGEPVDNQGITTSRTRTFRNVGTAQIVVPFTDSVSGLASYNYGITFFDDPDLSDRISHEFMVGISKMFEERTTVSSTYAASLFRLQTGDRRTAHELMFSLDHQWTPTLLVELRIGANHIPELGETALVGTAMATKNFQYSQALISYSQRLSSGAGAFDEPAFRQNALVQIGHALGDRASLALAGSYDHTSSTGVPAGQTSPTASGVVWAMSGRVAIDYTVASWLNATAALRYTSQHASDSLEAAGTASDMRRRIMTVTLNGTWERQLQ